MYGLNKVKNIGILYVYLIFLVSIPLQCFPTRITNGFVLKSLSGGT